MKARKAKIIKAVAVDAQNQDAQNNRPDSERNEIIFWGNRLSSFVVPLIKFLVFGLFEALV